MTEPDAPVEVPATVRVGPFVYRQSVVKRIHKDGRLGECDFMKHRIRLRAGQDSQCLAVHQLHEWLHAIHDAQNLEDGMTEEEFTTRGAHGLQEFVRSNPEAFLWWLRLALPDWSIVAERRTD